MSMILTYVLIPRGVQGHIGVLSDVTPNVLIVEVVMSKNGDQCGFYTTVLVIILSTAFGVGIAHLWQVLLH